MAKVKDLHIEACEDLARGMAKLCDYEEDYLFERLQECIEEDGLNEGIKTFVGITLECDW